VAPAGDIAAFAFAGRGLALTVLAIGLGWSTFKAQQTLDAIRRLADRIVPFPGAGTLSAGLADAMGDSGLRLVYALPGRRGRVYADGLPADFDLAAVPPERLTEIRRGDEVVAIAIGSSGSTGEPIPPSLGVALQLAADNERLLASVRHELIELRRSRARIVETGDAARRILERNLHDGAQQRMLGIIHDLSIARDAAAAMADRRTAALAAAVDAADDTIDALRALARGIHPGLLEEAGLLAAVEALADEALLPVVVRGALNGRYAVGIESAAWRVIAQTVADASRRGAAVVRVEFEESDNRLVVAIGIEGLAGAIDTVSLADVVAAVGGELLTSAIEQGTMRIRADLPCG
jgi:signal transduction histidine kinase